jgi:hypothetical protein
MDIDGLEAGPELDWLVLHHALDWKQGFPALGQAPYTCPGADGARVDAPTLPPVSTEIAEAWRLVEHVEARRLGFSLSHQPDAEEAQRWTARVWRDRPPAGVALAHAPTAPWAIARAVLKAVQASLVVKGFRPE